MKTLVLNLTLLVLITACGGGSKDTPPSIQPNVPMPNTPAQITGDNEGTVASGSSEVQGKLNVSDAQSGEAAFQPQSSQAVNYGLFSIDATGQWTFMINTASNDYAVLAAGETGQVNITVRSVDGTQHTIQVTVTGINDLATFNSGDGVSSASVEAGASEPATGNIQVTDVDNGEGEIVAQVNAATTYGTFSIAENGQWSYQVDANNAEVTSLAAGEQLLDVVEIQSDDDSRANISITIRPSTSGPSSPARGSIGSNDSVPTVNCTTTVSSTSALEDAATFNMTAGETLCLAAGNYSGLDLSFGGNGTSDAPITVAAAVSGEVTISGEVFVGMTGSYVVLQGFVFKDGTMGSSLLQLRANGNTSCNNCRVTENAFIDMDEGMTDSTKWLLVYGSDNRIDHNWFSGKTTRGALLVIERGDGIEDRTLIDHNYFGDRPPARGLAYAESSDNEYEAIRVGSSSSHTSDSNAVIEHNYFERIDAEAEVISNKAGGTTIYHNTVRNSRGSIVTRHGEGATISNNFIFGDGNPFSSGIRIIDADHTVINNYIEGIRYQNSNFHGGLLIHGSDGSTSNGYQQVENVLVANNTLVDSVESINVFAGRHSRLAETVYFVNNVVADAIGPVVHNVENMPVDSIFAGNYIYGQELSDDDAISMLDGMLFIDSEFAVGAGGLFRPTDSSPNLTGDISANIASFSFPSKDMDGQSRSDAPTAGADEISQGQVDVTAVRLPLTRDLVGPISYTPPVTAGRIVPVDIINEDFDSQDLNGWISVGATVTTETAKVFSRKSSVELTGQDASISQVVTVNANTNYTFSAFIKGNGKLGVIVGANLFEQTNESSDYRFTTVSFNSGDETSVTISASKIPPSSTVVATPVPLANANFDNAQSDWLVTEDNSSSVDTIGQVQDSSNSSTNVDGSIKFKYNADDNGMPYDPFIAQTVEVTSDTDYRLTMHILLKSNDEQDATVVFGAHGGEALQDTALPTALNSKESFYNALSEDSGAEDSFREDSVEFNSGSNTQVAIFAQYKSTLGDDIRIDEFSLDSLVDGGEDTSATYVDSFRLVSHPSLPAN